ncbi:uncharacterized protein V6R79_000174 [Siganus canaliculatus]
MGAAQSGARPSTQLIPYRAAASCYATPQGDTQEAADDCGYNEQLRRNEWRPQNAASMLTSGFFSWVKAVKTTTVLLLS